MIPIRGFIIKGTTAERAGNEVVTASIIQVPIIRANSSDFLFHGYFHGGGALFQLSAVLNGNATTIDGDLVGFGNHTSGNDGSGIDAYIVINGRQSSGGVAFCIFPVGNNIPVTGGGEDQHVILGLEEGRNGSA